MITYRKIMKTKMQMLDEITDLQERLKLNKELLRLYKEHFELLEEFEDWAINKLNDDINEAEKYFYISVQNENKERRKNLFNCVSSLKRELIRKAYNIF